MVRLRLQAHFDCIEGIFDVFAYYTGNLRLVSDVVESYTGAHTEPKIISSTASMRASLPFTAKA